MGWEEGLEDDGPDFRPPLPPDDRIWRHPAEVGAAAVGVGGSRTGRNPWAVGFVSVMGVVLLAGSLMLGAGGVGEKTGRISLQPVGTLAPASDGGLTDPADHVVGIDVATSSTVRSGNGIVVRADGYVVTTAALVADARAIRVVLADGTVHAATVAGVDELHDVAVVKIDAALAPPPPFAVAGTTGAGDTLRIVAGARGSRSATWAASVTSVQARLTVGNSDLYGVIEIDTWLDDSATGAAIFDDSDRVVGLVTTIGSTKAERGFAVPARTLRRAADQIMLSGSVGHGWIGIEGTTAPVENDDDIAGVRVRQVIDESPAQRSGILPGDLVVAVGGEEVPTMGRLVMVVREHAPHSTIVVEVVRDDERLRLETTLQALADRRW